jgi:hypothetical protein
MGVEKYNFLNCKQRHLLEKNDLSSYQSLHPGLAGEPPTEGWLFAVLVLTFWSIETFLYLQGNELQFFARPACSVVTIPTELLINV